MLRACRRVLKPRGKIAYYNIFVAEDLPDHLRRRIAREGNPTTYTRAQQLSLLRTAGFAAIQEHDVTDEYLRVQRALMEANERHELAMRRVLGDKMYEERQSSRRKTLRGIEAGYLRRSLFVAERPTPPRRAPPPRSAR